MNDQEIEKLAHAVNALRPDWLVSSLRTGIKTDLANRAYRDAALALVWVAVDPESKTPKRVTEDGPWWQATAPTLASEAARHTSSVPWEQLCDHCGRSEAHCRDPKVQAEDPHEFTTAAIRRARAAKAKPAPRPDPSARPYVNPELRAGIRADLTMGKRALASAEADWAERANRKDHR